MGYSPWAHKESDTTERLTLPLYFHTYTYQHLEMLLSPMVTMVGQMVTKAFQKKKRRAEDI